MRRSHSLGSAKCSEAYAEHSAFSSAFENVTSSHATQPAGPQSVLLWPTFSCDLRNWRQRSTTLRCIDTPSSVSVVWITDSTSTPHSLQTLSLQVPCAVVSACSSVSPSPWQTKVLPAVSVRSPSAAQPGPPPLCGCPRELPQAKASKPTSVDLLMALCRGCQREAFDQRVRRLTGAGQRGPQRLRELIAPHVEARPKAQDEPA